MNTRLTTTDWKIRLLGGNEEVKALKCVLTVALHVLHFALNMCHGATDGWMDNLNTDALIKMRGRIKT